MSLHNLPTPSGGAVVDYALASTLTTASVASMAGFFNAVNPILAFIGFVLGIWLAVRRLIRDYQRPD